MESTVSLKSSYQQADAETTLRVVLGAGELWEASEPPERTHQRAHSLFGGGWRKRRIRSPTGRKQHRGAIAQLGERWLCKPEVAGSIPAGSTSNTKPGKALRPTGLLANRDCVPNVSHEPPCIIGGYVRHACSHARSLAGQCFHFSSHP